MAIGKYNCEHCGSRITVHKKGCPKLNEPLSRSPDCYVAVPVEELKKLEAAREQLYQYLDGKITEQEMLGLVNITGQIWKVANRKQWD